MNEQEGAAGGVSTFLVTVSFVNVDAVGTDSLTVVFKYAL